MYLQSGTPLLTKRFTLAFALILIAELCSIVTPAQTINRTAVSAIVPTSEPTERVANAVVFENEDITVRRITILPNSTGDHYQHPGGSIILLRDYSFKIPIPLTEELNTELKVGDVIQVEPGDYVLENRTSNLLDFLSIEKKKKKN